MYRTARCLCLAISLSLCSLGSYALSEDEALRHAASLHKGGDTPRAMLIWEAQAARGSIDAAYNLAVIHHYGDGVALDYAKALQWYRQAAEQGDKASQFQIGLMYQTGQGVKADEAEAHRWFTMHRQHHLHHDQEPQMVAWRKQALALIEERDRHEQRVAAQANSLQVLADLKRRAGLRDEAPMASATWATGAPMR